MAYPATVTAMSREADHISGQDHDRISRLINDDDGPDISVSIAQKMLSAVTGSILTSLLVTPLDVVRVRLQSQSTPPPLTNTTTFNTASTLPTQRPFTNLPTNLGISTCCREVFWVNNNAPYCVAGPSLNYINQTAATSSSECAVEEVSKRTFTSTLDGLQKIARNEGPRTLWRGLTPTLVMAVPANVIYFAGYDWLRTANASPLYQMHLGDNYAPLVAGSFARTMAAVAVSPIEMFRTRIQAAHSAATASETFKETVSGMKQLVQERGYRSLWTGLNLTLWRDVPFSALYWWGYETGRNVLTDMREKARGRERIDSRQGRETMRMRSRSRSRENHSATLVDSFAAGAVSGAVAAFVTTPFDVGKTRQQVVRQAQGQKAGASTASHTPLPEELSMPRFLAHIYKEQGLKGLFRGWVPRVAKVAPACAIMISSYEVGKKMAEGKPWR